MAKVVIEIHDGVDGVLHVESNFGKEFRYPTTEAEYLELSNAQMCALGTIATIQHFIQEGQIPAGTVITGFPTANHK